MGILLPPPGGGEGEVGSEVGGSFGRNPSSIQIYPHRLFQIMVICMMAKKYHFVLIKFESNIKYFLFQISHPISF